MARTYVGSAKEILLSKSLEQCRRALSAARYADAMTKPLGYWSRAADRRLPFALLDRTISELLLMSFLDLRAIPGIGYSKIQSLIELLHRVMADGSSDGAAPETSHAPLAETAGGFDPQQVAEPDWRRWRATVRRHGLTAVPLGRLIRSLGDLPTGLWGEPLSTYLDYSLSELRNRPNYGAKRIAGVLRVFHDVHQLLGSGVVEYLCVELAPVRMRQIEAWLRGVTDERTLTAAEVDRNLVQPLLKQIDDDLGADHVKLVKGRLANNSRPKCVQKLAEREEMTRARIYQMFVECVTALRIRWPAGRRLLCNAALQWSPNVNSGVQSLDDVIDVLFPAENSD